MDKNVVYNNEEKKLTVFDLPFGWGLPNPYGEIVTDTAQ